MRNLLLLFSLIFIVSACESHASDSKDKPTATPKNLGSNTPVEKILKTCVSCHGNNGTLSINGAPFLAGQREQYLINAMSAYAKGVRHNDIMQGLMKPLSAEQIQGLAKYFASKKFKWNPDSIAKSEQELARQEIKKAISKGKLVPCASCHGKDGNSTNPGVPNLALLEPEYMEIALKGYISGERTDPFMVNFKLALSDVDIKGLSTIFSENIPKKSSLPAKGNVSKGQKLSHRCIGCHGDKGNSFVPPIPSLAGQNATYLTQAIKAYQTHLRTNPIMRKAAKGLTEKQIEDLAAYYAAQTPTKGKVVKNSVFDPIKDGKKIAKVCNACHGEKGNSQTPGVPSLTRLHPTYLMNAVQAYINGTRKHEFMSTLVKYLSPVEIDKVAHYYTTVPPEQTPFKPAGDASKGREIVAQCNNCHGNNGNSDKDKIPTLAGQDAKYIESAALAYKRGERKQEDMQSAIKDLTPQNIRDIAAYYALRKVEPPVVHEFHPPQEYVKKCVHCHGEKGISVDDSIPNLAGQTKDYLVKAITEYQDGVREHEIMLAMSSVMSLAEIDAVAEYFSKINQK